MLDVFKDYQLDGRDIVILGKGPSLDSIDRYNLVPHCTIGLNHVCRDIPVSVAHVIDLDVLDQLGDKLLTNCQALFMPYYPHLGWRPHAFLRLIDLLESHPILKQMKDRIYGYNLSTASQMINLKWNDSPFVWASHFSAEAVVNLLGKLGVKRIRTLGVDGGKGQSNRFSDLSNINSGGYDAEWDGIRKSIIKYGIDYSPIHLDSPIRVFIGAGEAQLIPALVLKHSILKYATMSIDVRIMSDWTHPTPISPSNRPRTPFSFQRFMIPEHCEYKGRAIYLDSDMLVFSDIKQIWSATTESAVLTMRRDDIDKHRAKYSAFLMDCSKTDWSICNIINCLDSGSLNYDECIFHLSLGQTIEDGFDQEWNSLEEYTEGKTKLLHYTEMYNQPWLSNPSHPLGHLWFKELKETVASGEITIQLLKSHIANRWIQPKCLEVLNDPAV